MTASYETKDGIAVVTLDNPPVNGLGFDTRRAVVDAIDRARRDDGIVAIVITGAGRAFSAGADIREFNSPKAHQAPTLPDVLEAVENCPKPVIAALNFVAMGGGLELALASHYRVATEDTQIALPEVRLGLLPGAGGTQRLPRAVGLEIALNMIVTGATIKASELASTRIFDRIVAGNVLEGAIVFARELREQDGHGAPLPRVRDWRVEHDNPEGFLAFARIGVARAAKNLPAPLQCVDAVAAAVTKSFDEGLKIEREAFLALMQTPESRSLRHGFFAERAAGKIPDIGSNVRPRDVREVAVVGAGTMGGGIAMAFLNAGYPVVLLEAQQEALDRGLVAIRKNYENSVKKGKLSAAEVTGRLALLRPTLAYDDLRAADLVIEAVFEDMQVKSTVLRAIDAVAKPGAILGTNTSTLDVNRLAAVTQRPQDVIGLHFFSPANIMRLLEVVRGEHTAADVLATAMHVASKIRKVAVVSGVCDGFIGNRMVQQYFRQAGFLLDEGVLPWAVDKAAEKFGFAMGPFRTSDLAGNDIGWAIRKRRAVEQPNMIYSRLPDMLCERGRFGQKIGAGWYDYKPGDRAAQPSPEVEEMVREYAKGMDLKKRTISDQEIVARLAYALANEGANILEEKIAARASDIDLVYLNGYGFPAARGGPMFYADTAGLYNVLRQMRGFAEGYRGEAWQPAPLLVRLAEGGGTFNGGAA